MSGASYKTSSSSGFSSNAISGGDRSAKEGTYSIWAKHTNGYSSTNRQIGLGYKKKNTSTQGSRKTGWRTSRISGDSDSGISSSYLYTTAVNFGSNQTVNGVPFTGVGNVDSGTGWEITEGFSNHHGPGDSSVSGNIGAILDTNFKFQGNRSKLKISGLVDGQTYVFSLYSQAWDTSTSRYCQLSCSDMSETIVANQDKYGGSSPDGLLIECTYIADGTDAEFTFDAIYGSDWHLYAFSNREATSMPAAPISGNGNWRNYTATVKDGYLQFYVDGATSGSAIKFYPGKDEISALSLGRALLANGPDGTIDEATFSTIGRSSAWITASYQNQKPDQGSNNYLNFESFVGPISLDDPSGTIIYGKKDTTLSYTIPHSGSGSFSATGLPSGLAFINTATGEISGSTSVVGSQNFTVTATGTTAGGGSLTVSKQYTLVITDPTSFPYRMDLTLSGYTGSSTLTDFPLLVEFNRSISGFSYNGFLDPDGDGVPTGSDLRFLHPVVRNSPTR